MKSLLGDFSQVALPIIILVAGVGIAILLYAVLKKRFQTSDNYVSKYVPKEVSVKLSDSYCSEYEMKFLEYLHRAMPKEFIAFPRVGVDNLVNPTKDRLAYNAIMSKYVDVCVFLRKSMKPILVVDLYENSANQQQNLKTMDQNVVNVLKAVKLPVVKIQVQQAYDIDKLRDQIIDAVPDKILAVIKDSAIK